MNIVMTTQITGTRNGLEWPAPGTEIDLPDIEAKDLLRAGNAVLPGDYRPAGLTDAQLGGAPSARDITLGQPDTNLARARAVAEAGEAEARAAAKRVGLDDEPETGTAPKVGDVEAAVAPEGAETAVVDTKPKRRSA